MVWPIELFLIISSFLQLLWYVLSCLWDGGYKRSFAANPQKEAYVMVLAGFLSCYLNDPLSYVWHHIK